MPKSDTCPDGVTIETTKEMDSGESCDITSNDGLQDLSAEEKACLMFLEETIQSLDMEDSSQSNDGAKSFPASGNTSNDGAENFPPPGYVATKIANLSASMDRSKHKDVPEHYSDEPGMIGSAKHNEILNYLVSTPLVLANSGAYIPPKPGTAASQKKLPPKLETAYKSDKPRQGGIHVPSEGNVAVLPPAVPIKDGSERGQELQVQSKCVSLSNECVVQLPKCVSMVKKHESEKQNSGSRGTPEARSSKSSPPAVAPKPRNIPSHIAVFSHKGTISPNAESNIHSLLTSPGSRGMMKPDKARLEALFKLGLLKEKESEVKASIKEDSHATQSWRSHPELSRSRPLSPSFSAGNQELAGQPSQGSNVLRQRSVSDLSTAPLQPYYTKPGVGKASTLERSQMGLESDMSNCQAGSSGGISPSSPDKAQVSGQWSATSPAPYKLSHASGSSVPMPSMADERREALKKLGLLKS
ncbi:hypothetical protein P4O66_006130 [Electrophorus voltai]|uniref:Specifically androgen-regulated gene protein n=1 Tax=Electrophorus voltai TaxID=2609070 RepID=A0AAD8ZIC7_9TELE|nr:hypothetical protein P4O66_006130 [Electrophorus voltai]